MYIDLVLVRQPMVKNPLLRYAPAFSHLKKGDEVMIETDHGNEQNAQVISSYTISPHDDEYRFILDAVQEREPLLKVTAHIILYKFDFKEEEKDEHDSGEEER